MMPRLSSLRKTSQTGGGRIFDQIVAQNRVDRSCSLKHAAHSLHAAEQIAREPGISEKMIVEKVEMPPRQSRNLSQRVVHGLCVERAPAGEERILVTERAMM